MRDREEGVGPSLAAPRGGQRVEQRHRRVPHRLEAPHRALLVLDVLGVLKLAVVVDQLPLERHRLELATRLQPLLDAVRVLAGEDLGRLFDLGRVAQPVACEGQRHQHAEQQGLDRVPPAAPARTRTGVAKVGRVGAAARLERSGHPRRRGRQRLAIDLHILVVHMAIVFVVVGKSHWRLHLSGTLHTSWSVKQLRERDCHGLTRLAVLEVEALGLAAVAKLDGDAARRRVGHRRLDRAEIYLVATVEQRHLGECQHRRSVDAEAAIDRGGHREQDQWSIRWPLNHAILRGRPRNLPFGKSAAAEHGPRAWRGRGGGGRLWLRHGGRESCGGDGDKGGCRDEDTGAGLPWR